ncbi:Pseudouridylate synthase, variant 3 [Balamuthia mandrillaris]
MSRSLCEKVEEDDLEFSSRLVSALTSSVPVTASPSNTCSSPKFAFFPSFFSRNAACSAPKQASSLESNPAVKNDSSASSQPEQKRMHFTSPAPSYPLDGAPHSPNASYKQPSISTSQPAAISYSSTPSTLLSGTAASSSFSAEVTSTTKRYSSAPFQPEQKRHSAVSVPSSFLGRTSTFSSDTLLQTVHHTQWPSPDFSTLQHGSIYSPASSVSSLGAVSSSSFSLSRPKSNTMRQTLEGARFIHPHSKPSSLERLSSQPFRVFDFRSGNIHSSAAYNERPSVSEKSSKSVTLPLLLEKSQHSNVVCETKKEGGAIKAEMPANRPPNEASEACSLEVTPHSVRPAKPSVTQLSVQTTNEILQQHGVPLTNEAEPTFSSKKGAQVNDGPVLQQVVNAGMVKADVGTASDEIWTKSKQKDATEEMEHGAEEEHKPEMYGKVRKETDVVAEEIVKVMEEEVEFKDEDVEMNLEIENELEVDIDEAATANVVSPSPEPAFSFGNSLTGLSPQTGPSMINEPQSQLTAVPSLYAASPCNAALLPSPEQHEQQTQYATPMQQLTERSPFCADKNESLRQHQRIPNELSIPSTLSQVGSKQEEIYQSEPNWEGVAILTIGPPDEATKEEAQLAGEQREEKGLRDVATSECVEEDCSVMVESGKKSVGNQERTALVNDRFAVRTHLLDTECKVGHSEEEEQTLLQLELYASPTRDKVKDSTEATPKITPSSPPSSPSSPLAISASPSAPSTTLFSSSPSSSISSPASLSSSSRSFSSPSSHLSSFVAPIVTSVSSSASPISSLPTSNVVDACPTNNTTSLADRPITATIPVTTEICAPSLAVEGCDPSQPSSPFMWTRKRKNFVQTETFQPEDLASSSQREEPLLIVPPIGEYKQEQQREQQEAEDVPQPKEDPEQYSSQPLIEDSPEPLEDCEDDFWQRLDDSVDNVQNGSEMMPSEEGKTGDNEFVRVPCQGDQEDGLDARLESNGYERLVKVASSGEEEEEEKHEERKEIEQEENGQLTERMDDQEERDEVCKRLFEDEEELGEDLDEPGLFDEDTDLDEDSTQSCADEESAKTKQNGTSRKESASQQAPINKDCSPFSFNIAEAFGLFGDHTPASLSCLRQNHATSNNDEETMSNEEYFLPKNPPTPPGSNSSLVPEGLEGNQAFDYVLAGYNPTFSHAASLSVSRRHPDDSSTIPPTNALCKWPALRKRKRVSVLHPTSVLPKQGRTGGCRLDLLETAGKSRKRNHHHTAHNDPPHAPEE